MSANPGTAALARRKKPARGKDPAVAGDAALGHASQNTPTLEEAKQGGLFALRGVVQPRRGKSSPADHPDLPYIGLEHVEAHTTRLLGSVPAKEMKSTANRFQPGDVLYSRLRPYLNKVWRADREGLCSSEFIVMPGNERIDAAYLCYRLNSRDFVSFANSLNAGDRPRVDFEQISTFQTWLPNTLAEQRRIVAEIEKQFTRQEAGVAALRRVQANLKRYRAAVLKAACEGRLVPTEAELRKDEGGRMKDENKRSKSDAAASSFEAGSALLARILIERRQNWQGRGQYKEPAAPQTADLPSLPEGWTWAQFGYLGKDPFNTVQTGPFGAQLHNTDFTESGVPVIAVGNLTGTGFRTDGLYFVSDAKAKQLARYDVWAGDLLFARSGATLGKVCVAPEAVQGWRMTGHILRARLNQDFINPKIAVYALAALPAVRKQVFGNVRGVTRPGFNTGLLESILIPIPPLAEQTRIVAEVERRLSVVEELESVVTANLQRATRLRQSILQKALNGKL
jgi:type I restriction enzyme S subunit